jgi:fibro-slime domain-containing protein
VGESKLHKKLHKLCLGVSAGAVALGLSAVGASANSVEVTWYSASPTFGDFNLPACGTYDCGQVYDNSNPEVGPTLIGNRPVVSAGNPAGLVEGAGNPLNWWTPSSGITLEGQTIAQLPINQSMFVPEGTGSGDGSTFQTAIFSATLHVGASGGSITFGGDDDMFLALNGNVVDEVGGVHPSGSTSTWNVGAGTYAMEIFYADRHVTDALANIQLAGDITTSVPEPSTWAMILIGFAGLGYASLKRGRKDRLAPAIA